MPTIANIYVRYVIIGELGAGLLVYQSLAVAGSGRGGDRAAHDGWVLAQPSPAQPSHIRTQQRLTPELERTACHLSCVDI